MVWRCRSSPCRGKSAREWQFRHRGCMSTGTIFSKRAADRAGDDPPASAATTRSPGKEAGRSAKRHARIAKTGCVRARMLSALRSLERRCRTVHGFADAFVRAATTDVRDGGVDIRIARMAIRGEQCHGRHDHAALAVAALRHLLRDPGLLHRVTAVAREALDRRDVAAFRRTQREGAGTHRAPLDVYGAGSAQSRATAILRSRKSQTVAEDP